MLSKSVTQIEVYNLCFFLISSLTDTEEGEKEDEEGEGEAMSPLNSTLKTEAVSES